MERAWFIAWFAAFFLLGTFFRPAGAYFTQLRRRLGALLKDVRLSGPPLLPY
ncbi:hypothetical protein [Streptomyces chartreusis]|uniref:hypothetical protein n=1 Tax=Streptomyces chartreusis TaxID=1969 RepID=UPI00362D2246